MNELTNLEETRVEVEDVTGVGLTTRGTAEQQGHLTVSDGLLGQVVIHNQRVLAVVTEVLAHGGTSVGGEVLEGGGIGGGGRHNDGVLQGICRDERVGEMRNHICNCALITIYLLEEKA